MNILAVGAHPDDIELGCSGTLLNYKENGNRIFLLVITNGENGGNDAKNAEPSLAIKENVPTNPSRLCCSRL